ncbi:endonuclease/exonuclease/phosphatase family protein [Frondihabitans sp. Leaf304]|uniref:endonuclease/exonuclease/phosphatase family protein n=1 Tax=Frondihabitans sp. Leaf304 TaxID=1736329 RepID=UPI000B1E3BE0|nr:endonuclease/exonuclease/phosphatase family protein [Frondihabitans sp. Leaf304]
MIRRLVSFVLLLALAAALFVVAFPQVLGLEQRYYVAQVIAFRGILVVVAVVVAVVFLFAGLALRAVRSLLAAAAVLLLVFAAITGGVLVERGTGSTKFDAKAAGDVRVLAWNTLGGAPGASTIAKLAVNSKADIVSLPETTRKTANAVAAKMKAAKRPVSVLVLAYDKTDSAKSTALLISTKLGTYRVVADDEGGTTPVLPTVVARPADGSGPVIVAAHPAAPVKALMTDWRAGLRYLAKLCSGESMIMAGDFNSTLDHQSGLGSKPSTTLGSCRDAAKASANGAVGTWPTTVPALLAAPIDHVMATSDWSVSGFRVITTQDGSGSDHRPVLAQLTPASTD